MPQQPGEPYEWPNAEQGTEKGKIVFTAQVDVVSAGMKSEQDQEAETHKDALSQASARVTEQAAEERAESDSFRAAAVAERTADLANLSMFFDSMSTLAVGAVERGRTGAEVVQKASAAIVTLYTGILALVFAAGDNPLPTRGVLAPIFLGLAVVLSTAYLGYVSPSRDVAPAPAVVAGVESKTYARLNTTTSISSIIATRRSYLLRAGVLALGVGLVFIVLPFVNLRGATPANAAVAVSTPAWPAPPSGPSTALNSIVYKAQVDEVASLRKIAVDAAATPQADNVGVLLLIGIAGLLVTFGVPAIWKNE